jgi:hypothetical protein
MAAKIPSTPFYLPPGRMVMGDLVSLQENDQQGRKREHPTVFFGVAVPKTDARVNGVLEIIRNVAWSHYQHTPGIKDQIALGLAAPNFAWKVDDGDSEKNKDREGFAGCWIFRYATTIIPVKAGDSQDNPIDPAVIKCGFYIDVSSSVAPNGLTDKNAGVYLNPVGVRLLGYGKEIQWGPTIKQMFAQHAATLPPGASALPVGDNAPLGGPAPIASGTPTAPSNPLAGAPLGGQPAAPGGPGFATGATPPPPGGGVAAPPPPMTAAPAVTVEMVQAYSAQLAQAAGVQHYPNFRIKPDRSGYDPDPLPTAPGAVASNPPAPSAPVAPSAPAGNPMGNPLGGASAAAVPAGAQPAGVPSMPPPGSPTASLSNGVQPHPGFLQPPPHKTPDEVSAEMAAAMGVQHHPGWRIRPDRTGYDPNPAA